MTIWQPACRAAHLSAGQAEQSHSVPSKYWSVFFCKYSYLLEKSQNIINYLFAHSFLWSFQRAWGAIHNQLSSNRRSQYFQLSYGSRHYSVVYLRVSVASTLGTSSSQRWQSGAPSWTSLENFFLEIVKLFLQNHRSLCPMQVFKENESRALCFFGGWKAMGGRGRRTNTSISSASLLSDHCELKSKSSNRLNWHLCQSNWFWSLCFFVVVRWHEPDWSVISNNTSGT